MRTNFFLSLALVTLFTLALSASFPAYSQEESGDSESPETASDEQRRYISDDLFIYLRAGPGKDYRLLGSINAGTQVRLLNVDRELGYAEIIDQRQRTGWVEIRFVSRIPTIRYELEDMQSAMAENNEAVLRMQAEVDAVMLNLSKFDEQKSSLNRQISQQLEEIARLNERSAKRERANNTQWLSRGALIAGVCIFIGYLMGLFGRKRKNSDRLI